jgi:hypothetical protein
MSEKMTRRDFVSGSALAGGALIAGGLPMALAADGMIPRLPTDFAKCPRTMEPFLQYIVQRRAVEGLNAISTNKGDTRHPFGTIYGGKPEDMYIAWTAGTVYRNAWSRFHKDETLRRRTFLLVDSAIAMHEDGNWDDGGLNSFFVLQAFAMTVLEWKESGDVDAARMKGWMDALVKTADNALRMHYGPYHMSASTGQYANPEMYYLSGLAVVWKLTGDEKYRTEAGLALKRYDEWLFKGGGVAYILESSPVVNYQHLVAISVPIYWEMTGDPYAMEFMRRMLPYFPNVVHRSGLITDAEHPQLKHNFAYMTYPGIPAILAVVTGDGQNRYAGDVALNWYANGVDDPQTLHRLGMSEKESQLATYAAGTLRMMEKQPLPAAIAPSPRRVFQDDSYRGVRSHWDDFMAATTTRQMSDSLAGAYIADESEPLQRIQSAVDGVLFEVIQDLGKKDVKGAAVKTEFRGPEWSPTVTYASGEGLEAKGCVSRVCAPVWVDMPYIAGEPGHPSDMSDWMSVQHWAVWQDHLVGLGALACHTDGGNAGDVARVRWRLSPADRELKVGSQTDKALRFEYGRLAGDLECLGDVGGCGFRPEKITEAPRAAWTPLLVKQAPWKKGDAMHVATVVRPANATGKVKVGSVTTGGVKTGAVAVLLDAGGLKAHVWIVNLTRHQQNYLWTVPSGIAVRTYKRDVTMPPIPPGQPAHAGLIGGESLIWVLESAKPFDADALLAAVTAGASIPA